MKKYLIVIIFILLISLANAAQIDKKIEQELNKNEQVEVIVYLKEPSLAKNIQAENFKNDLRKNSINSLKDDFKLKYEYSSLNGFSGKINKNALEKLKNNPNIKEVYLSQKRNIFLQDSLSLINATIVHAKQVNGINLTGKGQSICVLDTGINYSHNDFGSCTSAGSGNNCKITPGYDYVCSNGICGDDDPYDDHGHGTRVSGIIAANGNLIGVAPEANLTVIKVCDEWGVCDDSYIMAGIDFCINNRTKYNINAISMSLGSGLFNDYCNDDSLTPSINNAVANNITVVIATGNNGNNTAISAPGCIENATSVGAVNKQDSLVYNRNRITDIVAPGININSTNNLGNYISLSGTSMSTPHVAGLVALLQQYKKLIDNKILTQSEVEKAIKSSNKIITDTTGLNYTRINADTSISSLDLPNVILNYPENNINLSDNTINFNCSATSNSNLLNLSLYLNQNNSFILNKTSNISGTSNSTNFTLNLNDGIYYWNCLAYNILNNSNFYLNNFTFIIDTIAPLINLTYPINNSINKTSFDIDFYFNFYELNEINNCSLIINDLVNKTINSSINKNEVMNISINLQPSTYNFSVSCTDNFNNIGISETRNFSTFGDVTNPSISSISSSPSSSSSTITWISDEYSNSSVNYGTNSSNLNLVYNDNTFVKSHSITLSSLTSSTTYYYNLTSCDISNNCESSNQGSFTTTSSSSSSSGGSSGGSGGGGGSSGGSNNDREGESETIKTITKNSITTPKEEKIDAGILTQTETYINIEKGEIVTFTFASVSHSVKLLEVTINTVTIEISSTPKKLTLKIHESKEVDVDEDGKNDLSVTLKSITDGKADLIFKLLEIVPPTEEKVSEEKESFMKRLTNIISGKTTFTGRIIKDQSEKYSYRIGSIVALCLMMFIFYKIFLKKQKVL